MNLGTLPLCAFSTPMASVPHRFEIFPARIVAPGEKPVLQWSWRRIDRRSTLSSESFESFDACVRGLRARFGPLRSADIRVNLGDRPH